MRFLGMMLDDVIDKPSIIEEVYGFLRDNSRSLKLVFFNKNVNDLKVAQFIKQYEKKLGILGSQVTRDFTIPVYFFIGREQVSSYTMWYKGDIEKGIEHFRELLDTQDERRKHIR